MRYTIAEIAKALEAQAVGDTGMVVTGLSEPAQAGAEHLALASNAKYADEIASGSAKAALLWDGADWQALGLTAAVLPKRPRFAMSRLTTMADPGQGFGSGIHPNAIVDPTARIGADVTIAAGAVIAADAGYWRWISYWSTLFCRMARFPWLKRLFARARKHRRWHTNWLQLCCQPGRSYWGRRVFVCDTGKKRGRGSKGIFGRSGRGGRAALGAYRQSWVRCDRR